jgi:ketosteroid isomerase-like protein
MKNATNRSTAAKKAAITKKRRAAAKKAATTRKRRVAGKKAADTRKHRAAGRKAAATRTWNLAAKKRSDAAAKANKTRKRNAMVQGAVESKSRRLASVGEIKSAMASVNDLFNREVVGKGNIAALDDVYTSDARILPPAGPMISGREAIKRFWADLSQSASAKSVVLSSVDVIPSPDGVVEIGRATLTVAPPGQAEAQMEVKYVVYWKQEGGRWKWHVDIWNPNS